MAEATNKSDPAAQPQMVDLATVQKMMDEQAKTLMAGFAKKIEELAATTPAEDASAVTVLAPLLEKQAMMIAELTDQNAPVRIQRLAPAEIQARNAAYERMGALLVEAQAKPSSEWPIYKLVAKTQLNSKETGPRIVDPIVAIGKNEWAQVRIQHAGMPNLAMRPVNDAAKAIYKEYVRYLGGSEAANRIAPQSPAWMTDKGTIIMSAGPQTVRAHGGSFEPEPIRIDGEDLPGEIARRRADVTQEMLLPNDPRATEIHVLGTLADPARTGMTSARTV